jgi:hypothetical protein
MREFRGGGLADKRYKCNILNNLRLHGGASSERTILHRRIPFKNLNLGPNWPLPVIRT